MQDKKSLLVQVLMAMSRDEVAAANAQLVADIVAEHRMMQMRRRADPPSDGVFAALVGLKADTYSKARRSSENGGAPSLSKLSLAAIVFAETLPDVLRARAHELLWLSLFQGRRAASRDPECVRRAFCHPVYFARLAAERAELGADVGRRQISNDGEDRHAARLGS